MSPPPIRPALDRGDTVATERYACRYPPFSEIFCENCYRVAEQGRSQAESGTAKIESSRDIDYEDSHHSQRSALRHGAILRRLRLAHASLRNDPQTEVTVFLMADAVVFVRKGAENAGRLLQYRASSKARQRRQRHEKMRGGIVRLFRDLELITHDLTES